MAGAIQKLKENKKAMLIAAVGILAIAGGGVFFSKIGKAGGEHGDAHAAAGHGEAPHGDVHGAAGHGEAPHGDAHAAAGHGEAPHGDAHGDEDRAPASEHATHSEHPAQQHTGFFGRFWQAAKNIHSTVQEIRRLDLENQRLRLEVAQLRLRLEAGRFEQEVSKARELTEAYASQVDKKAGTRVGRTLASIAYKPPTHLLPRQLHALAVSQFEAGEYEKSAVIFTMLSEMSKEPMYQTHAHRLLTGINWYRLKNWDMAGTYFDRILSDAGGAEHPSEQDLKHFAQARLWKAVVAQQRGQKKAAQKWMAELVEHHPRSPEARWINFNSGESGGPRVRVPASKHH